MVSKITKPVWVGLTTGIAGALESASEFYGIKPSQYARQAIFEKLIRDGFMKHPVQIVGMKGESDDKPA